MEYGFKNLVFEGGGVRGVAYAGALEALESENVLRNIERVGGASAGAIAAVLTGLGYCAAEIKKTLEGADFKKFMDGSAFFIVNTARLLARYGWLKGDYFHGWIAGLIAEKTGAPDTTFAQAHAMKNEKGFRDIFLIGTNLSTRFAEVFSHEPGRTPDMPIADAARISMSIPLLFAAVKKGQDVYVDGGMLNNYPVKLFDRVKYIAVSEDARRTDYYEPLNIGIRGRGAGESEYVYNRQTLGFRLDSEKEIEAFKNPHNQPSRGITSLTGYIENLVKTQLEIQNSMHLHADDWHRTVYIDTLGVSATDFSITAKTKKALISSGRGHTEAYLAMYADPAIPFLNRD